MKYMINKTFIYAMWTCPLCSCNRKYVRVYWLQIFDEREITI